MNGTQTKLGLYIPKDDYKPIHSSALLEELKLSGIYEVVHMNAEKRRIYPNAALLAFIIWKHLKGIKSDRKALKMAAAMPGLFEKMGFKVGKNPKWNNITQFRNQTLTTEGQKQIQALVEEFLHDNSYFVMDSVVPKPSRQRLTDPLKRLSRREKKKIIKDTREFLDGLRSNAMVAPNVKFTDRDIFEALTFMVTSDLTPNAFSEANRFLYEAYERKDAPSNNTILNWIRKNFSDRVEVYKFTNFIIDRVFEYIKKYMPGLTQHHTFPIAIDTHLIPTWEDTKKGELQLKGEYQSKRQLTNPSDLIMYVPKKKSKKQDGIEYVREKYKSTIHFRKYISASLVLEGMRFCMGYIPISSLNNIEQKNHVSALIDMIKKHVGIKVVLLDRNFEHVQIHSLLQKRGIHYIMPKIINSTKLDEYRDTCEGYQKENSVLLTKYTERREKKHVNMNLIFIKTKNKNFKKKGYTGEDKQKEYVAHGFCTNIPIKTKGAARAIVEQYKARWGIESFYKDSKFFYLKTTSNNSIIRDFFFAMSVITFNLWILCNLICFIAYLRRPPEKPRIRMRTFAQSLKGIEYKDPPPDED